MKKIFKRILLLMILLFPINAFAEGYVTISPTSLTIEQGSSQTINITAYNVIGDVSISSSNGGVASVSTGEWSTGMVDEHQTRNGSITVTGQSVGSTTIVFTVDGSTFDEEDVSGQRFVNVNVVAKPEPVPEPTPTPTPSPDDNKQDNKSHNNSLKELSVDGYKVEKIDNNNYTLTVLNDVKSIKVNAVSEDTKATVAGNGNHDLNVGDNDIEIVITSESGETNKINLKVTRKDAYYLEDLDTVLKDDNINDISITADTTISSEIIKKIQDSKKKVNFNYYENNNLIYSIIVDGTKENKTEDMLTTIVYDSEYKEDIAERANYADGLYMSFKQNSIPSGITLKLYVGNKYSDNDILNIYSYNIDDQNLNLIQSGLKIENGYVQFDLDNNSNYLLTKSNVSDSNVKIVLDNKKNNNKKNCYISIILAFILGVITGVVIVKCILKQKRKMKKAKISNSKDEIK
ncbi:MAG: cadherin-like beta sandwich domain-containing protein [Bacilli bacterium]|nr:cadherin-like beta sandwich domain-containing protein [Bacilli bacterium]